MKTFVLRAEHVLLLRHAEVGWQDTEVGAPEIDPKRPYGNGDVVADVHKILTGESWPPDSRAEEERLRVEYARLHRETETALAICLRQMVGAPGLYEADDYHSNWRDVDPVGRHSDLARRDPRFESRIAVKACRSRERHPGHVWADESGGWHCEGVS